MPAPERTSIAAIVAAGRAILEEAGPAGLTMQAVAVRVGVRAPSLYKRVRDRDALLAAVAESAADDVAARLDAAGDELPLLAAAYRTFAHAHPEAFRLLFSPVTPEDALHRSSAPVLRACATLVGDADSLAAARLFTAWTTGFLQMELAGAFRLGGDVSEAFDYGLGRIMAGLTS